LRQARCAVRNGVRRFFLDTATAGFSGARRSSLTSRNGRDAGIVR